MGSSVASYVSCSSLIECRCTLPHIPSIVGAAYRGKLCQVSLNSIPKTFFVYFLRRIHHSPATMDCWGTFVTNCIEYHPPANPSSSASSSYSSPQYTEMEAKKKAPSFTRSSHIQTAQLPASAYGATAVEPTTFLTTGPCKAPPC